MSVTPPQILDLQTIKTRLESIDVFEHIKNGFVAFSKGEAVIPPVGELVFEKPPGDVHIKYGYLKSQPYFVVKIASGFYENPILGLPSSQGLNLLFDKSTGMLKAILLDEGHLTDVRTAVAGALASRALANPDSKLIGIVGAGVQARYQMQYHAQLFPNAHFVIWNRKIERAKTLAQGINQLEINAKAEQSLESLCSKCSIIVTTTSASVFLIRSEWVQKGTHITAIGSDTNHKIELDPLILQGANILSVDSKDQSMSRGEVFRARNLGLLTNKKILELGDILAQPTTVRLNANQITVADLTGVAVQDLMISQAVFEGN